MEKMLPRDGVKYSTVYVKQSLEQRKRLVRHIQKSALDIQRWIESEPGWQEFVEQPLKGFPTSLGKNRTAMTVIVDLIQEAQGKTRNGMPKDFALAPIDRWNKLFKDTEFEFELINSSSQQTQFEKLMEFAYD
jgi:hypothetical protein